MSDIKPETAFSPLGNSIAAPAGFRASGVAAGIKASGGLDVALIVAHSTVSAAAVFTTNRVQAAPILVSREHLHDGRARAVVVNSGNANACTGERGLADARRMAQLTAELVGCRSHEVIVASTGIIGQHLPMERIEAGIRRAASELAPEGDNAARAIMTTDLKPKEIAVEFAIDGKPVRIGGIAKGSGMIGPNMATMLAFVTTDAEVRPEVLKAALAASTEKSFNSITVDGDTSTNDMLALLASGAAGVSVQPDSPAFDVFCAGLDHVCTYLAKEITRDGEGATKLIELRVGGARTVAQARKVGMTVANSPLVKTAFYGNDPNWGRILAAAGRSGVAVDPNRIALRIGSIPLVERGAPLDFDAGAASAALKQPEVIVELDLGLGSAAAVMWTCDFSYDYVKINAEYHT
jgi:glutamate N-acetyltransferase / amino-acid N-acetyltransferase